MNNQYNYTENLQKHEIKEDKTLQTIKRYRTGKWQVIAEVEVYIG